MVRTAPQIELYSKAVAALSKSIDPHLEALREALSAPDACRRRPASPYELDVMVTTPSGNRETAYTALFRDGFLFIDLDRVGFSRFTEDEIDAHHQVLSAYESVAIVRSRAVSLKQSRPAIAGRYAEFARAATLRDRTGAVLAFQRMMLTCVAAVANEHLMKTYERQACVAYCYAWACRLSDPALDTLIDDVATFYDLYDSRDVQAAARVVANIRAQPYRGSDMKLHRAAS